MSWLWRMFGGVQNQAGPSQRQRTYEPIETSPDIRRGR